MSMLTPDGKLSPEGHRQLEEGGYEYAKDSLVGGYLSQEEFEDHAGEAAAYDEGLTAEGVPEGHGHLIREQATDAFHAGMLRALKELGMDGPRRFPSLHAAFDKTAAQVNWELQALLKQAIPDQVTPEPTEDVDQEMNNADRIFIEVGMGNTIGEATREGDKIVTKIYKCELIDSYDLELVDDSSPTPEAYLDSPEGQQKKAEWPEYIDGVNDTFEAGYIVFFDKSQKVEVPNTLNPANWDEYVYQGLWMGSDEAMTDYGNKVDDTTITWDASPDTEGWGAVSKDQ